MAFLVLRAGLGATPPSAATLAAAQAFLNNELYIGRLVWNRLTYLKDPKSGRGRSRYNPPAKWIVQDVLNSDDVFPVRPRTIPCSVSEIPCSDFKGIGGNTLNLLANAMAASPSPASSGKISLYFPAEQGIPRTETGSPMTAPTASIQRLKGYAALSAGARRLDLQTNCKPDFPESFSSAPYPITRPRIARVGPRAKLTN